MTVTAGQSVRSFLVAGAKVFFGLVVGWFLYIAVLWLPFPWFGTAIVVILGLVALSVATQIRKPSLATFTIGTTVGYLAAFLFILWISVG